MKTQIKRIINYSLLIINSIGLNAQLKWVNVDSLYHPLPSSVHVYKTTDSLDGKPNIAYYVIADLKDKKLLFDADTTLNRRLTPSQSYQKNNQPLVVVNTTFFSFQTNRSLNTVIMNGKLIAFNPEFVKGKGADSINYLKSFRSAIGITKKANADVAWIYTDSADATAFASQKPVKAKYPLVVCCELPRHKVEKNIRKDKKWYKKNFQSWRMQTAVGGGPVILQKGNIAISNEEELMFTGKAIDDKHPRTAMGYTKDNKLIILVVQGRFPGVAEGAALRQEAKILQDLGCWEALNLDGGGSSCMLVNGKETIKPSDAAGQRAVPAVFIIKARSKN
jgi:exopolysaccharide biosynthesis protein